MRSKETRNEFLQDIFTLYLLLETQKRIHNIYFEEMLGFIEVYFCSIVFFEHIKMEDELEKEIDPRLMPVLEKWRDRFLKQNIKRKNGKSRKIRRISNEMRLDPFHYMYDTVITKNSINNELLGINFGVWDLTTIEKEEKELFNQLLQTIMSFFNEELKILSKADFNLVMEQHTIRLNRYFQLKRYPFSHATMFRDNALEDEDKSLIMYYYSFFKYFSMIELLVPEITVQIGDNTIVPKYSLMKMKASLIDNFLENRKRMNTYYFTKIYNAILSNVDEQSVMLNKRLRTNIHYEYTKPITESQWDSIYQFQRVVFRTVIRLFDEALNVNTGKKYKTILWIALHTDSDFRKEYELGVKRGGISEII